MIDVPFYKALADETRMKIIQSLLEKPLYTEVLAERLSLSAATVAFHMKKLESAGLVTSKKEQYYKIYQLNKKRLDFNLLGSLKSGDKSSTSTQEDLEKGYEKKVIKSFFRYGKLESIPVQRKKKQIVLKHIIQAFDCSKVYSEKEFSTMLEDYHADYCTLRREMLADKLIERDGTLYRVVQ